MKLAFEKYFMWKARHGDANLPEHTCISICPSPRRATGCRPSLGGCSAERRAATPPWLDAAADESFAAAVAGPLPVLVDRSAPWCEPCRLLGLTVEHAACEFAGRLKVVTVNVDDAPAAGNASVCRSCRRWSCCNTAAEVARRVGALPAADAQQLARCRTATAAPEPWIVDHHVGNQHNQGHLPERLVALVGDGVAVPCVDGQERPYLNLDAAASTSALPAVAERVEEFLPWYSSVHRGAGYKSRLATDAYEEARAAALRFAGRAHDGDDIAIICRNTTEAINHLAYRLPLDARRRRRHHRRRAPRQPAALGAAVPAPLRRVRPGRHVHRRRRRRRPRRGARARSCWPSPARRTSPAGCRRSTTSSPPPTSGAIPVLVDAAQLAPHRPLPAAADYIAWSGHKMYAPFGAGVLIGPRATFADGDPFLAGGGAVDLVDLDEVVWTDPPEREEAGSPNVIGAVALDAAIDELDRIGWDADRRPRRRASLGRCAPGWPPSPASGCSAPTGPTATLPLATFTVDGVHHALVAARLSAEYGIGVRHGCFCAHPYLLRLLDLVARRGGRVPRRRPRAATAGRCPARCGPAPGCRPSSADIDRFLAAVADIAGGRPAPVAYDQDPHTGDYWPDGNVPGWTADDRSLGASCARG